MKPSRILILALAMLLAGITAAVAQQHSYTEAEINAGSKLFESNCGSCHGENGDKIVGIDFSKGLFKTAKTDEDLIRIIRNGVPNTGMPANPFNESQAGNLVAYVRSMVGGARTVTAVATNLTGDPARGKAIYEGKGTCTTCHSINGIGGKSGPELGPPQRCGRGGGGGAPPLPGGGGGGGGRGGAAAVNPQQLERSIVDPSAEIAAQYRIFQTITKNNSTTRGTLLNQDTFSIQMRDGNDKLVSFLKSDLKEFGFQPSAMPSFKGKLTPQEIADVVSYLVSLRSN